MIRMESYLEGSAARRGAHMDAHTREGLAVLQTLPVWNA